MCLPEMPPISVMTAGDKTGALSHVDRVYAPRPSSYVRAQRVPRPSIHEQAVDVFNVELDCQRLMQANELSCWDRHQTLHDEQTPGERTRGPLYTNPSRQVYTFGPQLRREASCQDGISIVG